MQIALFGASFDPPHNAHRKIIEEVLRQKLADQVWLVPVKSHPFAKVLSPENDRLQMVELFCAALKMPEQVLVNTFELQQDAPSYSYDTLIAFSALHPEHTFSWIIGSDNLANFSRWHRADELLKQFTVYVYPRAGFSHDQLLPGMKLIANVPEMDLSSTFVREQVAAGKGEISTIAALVEPEVAQYIKRNGIYADKS